MTVTDCGTSRSSWLARPIELVVARTEFWSVSALALTAIGCSTVPSLAAVARGADAAEAGAAGAAGATWASAATLKRPKPAASAPSGNSRCEEGGRGSKVTSGWSR